jgi:hypothetical protein
MLDDRKRLLLQSIYDDPSYAEVLPRPTGHALCSVALRQHQRFSIRCPARFAVASYGDQLSFPLQVIELSLHGFSAECALPLPEGTSGRVDIDLGWHEHASVEATAIRRHAAEGIALYGFDVAKPDAAWQRCVVALQAGRTHADLSLADSARAAPARV